MNDKRKDLPSQVQPGAADAPLALAAVSAAADTPPENPARRSLMKVGALAGLAGVGGGILAACAAGSGGNAASSAGASASASAAGSPGIAAATPAAGKLPEDYVAPGQLDEYYGIWSGGQSGEIRILGVPSMRELVRVPVFNPDFTIGWGITNESKRVLGEGWPNGQFPPGGDAHHPHMSMTHGHYDGRYIFINDKAMTRVARIRTDIMRCDRILRIPNVQAIHGMRVQREPRTGYVFANGEFRIPAPNDGRNLDDPAKYQTMFTGINGDTMEVAWQVLVDGNLDNVDSDYAGKYAAATCYNSEGGVTLADMMRSERDWVVVFNLKRIEEAVKAGKYKTIGDSKVPVVDGRHGSPLTMYIPVPKNPHGLNASPDGKYFAANGKLSPTVTLMQWSKVDDWFDGKFKDPRGVVVAEPQLGLGPLHTAYDGRGNAYTTLFIDSQIAKWNIQDAIDNYGGKKTNYLRQKLDVMYQPGHDHASLGETRDADGKWLVSLNKFSKNRFLRVGPLHPDNDQLIDISGDEMKLVADAPVWCEPHDCLIIPAKMLQDKIKFNEIWDSNDPFFAATVAQAKKHGIALAKDNKVIREGNRVFVYMTSSAPVYGLTSFKVKKGDIVTVIDTNIDDIQDLTHGWCLSDYGINMEISPHETASVTFVADKPGVHWYYCTFFCHALHLEMRGRMLVEA
ncbi:MAG: nitrous-oxide reductase [Rhodanobacteraceae bacterium]|nr:MAG: nitrous-oxide reductase [Rhodanobacteraceae bacterium]